MPLKIFCLMPKKPPFSRFRKSCCSPSNSNKKKKKLQVPSVPCKKCACLYHRWVCGAKGLQGAGVMFLVGLPAHKESMAPPVGWTCLPQKTIPWGQVPALGIGTPACSKECIYWCSPMPSGDTRSPTSHTRGTHCLGLQGALGFILCLASCRRA